MIVEHEYNIFMFVEHNRGYLFAKDISLGEFKVQR